MIPLPLGRVAEITSGALTGQADPGAVVRGPVVIDSRAAEPGSLFVAIEGERADGHDFAAQALASGAVAVLASRPVDGPAVVVDDVRGGAGQAGQRRGHRPVEGDRRRGHRLGREDVDQRPAGPVDGQDRSNGGAGGVVQQRDRTLPHGAQGRRGHPVPGAGAVRA